MLQLLVTISTIISDIYSNKTTLQPNKRSYKQDYLLLLLGRITVLLM